MTDGLYDISLTVNGETYSLAVAPQDTLIDVLRDKVGLTGTKLGCNQGVCGSCTVLLDGLPVRACLSLAVTVAGREIRTIEGLESDGILAPVQQAFVDHGAVQCGFCMPGMIVAAHALLAENPRPSADEVREGLSGNICRCSGYVKVIDAVRAVNGS